MLHPDAAGDEERQPGGGGSFLQDVGWPIVGAHLLGCHYGNTTLFSGRLAGTPQHCSQRVVVNRSFIKSGGIQKKWLVFFASFTKNGGTRSIKNGKRLVPLWLRLVCGHQGNFTCERVN